MKRYGMVLALAAAAALAACKGALDVENPGPIEDVRLNTPESVPSLVAGMSADLSQVLDEMVRITAIASDELAHGGSYTGEGLWYRGIIRPEDVNDQWSQMHRARFEAESGIERMKTIPGYAYENAALSARANVFAGLANRLLGETVCEAVIDGGPATAHTDHFQRAEGYLTEALRITSSMLTAKVDTANARTLSRVAYAGRASVRAWQGDWVGAVQDAQQVPASFAYAAVFSLNSTRENNSLVQETYVRREFTVFSTPWAQVFGDPRVPWDTIYTGSGASRTIQKGQDGRTNYFRQRKYAELGADIPLVKGAEMLMLRAEGALRGGDIPGAIGLVNQARAVYGLGALATPATSLDAWRVLGHERGATVWIEARRLWDLRRWYAEGGDAQAMVLERVPSWATRDKCIPISRDELQSNPNLSGR